MAIHFSFSSAASSHPLQSLTSDVCECVFKQICKPLKRNPRTDFFFFQLKQTNKQEEKFEKFHASAQKSASKNRTILLETNLKRI